MQITDKKTNSCNLVNVDRFAMDSLLLERCWMVRSLQRYWRTRIHGIKACFQYDIVSVGLDAFPSVSCLRYVTLAEVLGWWHRALGGKYDLQNRMKASGVMLIAKPGSSLEKLYLLSCYTATTFCGRFNCGVASLDVQCPSICEM